MILTPIPVIETERLILRKICKDDADDVQQMYSDKEMFLYTNTNIDLDATPFGITKALSLKLIESWENNKEQLCWGIVLKETNELVGRVYIYNFVGNKDIGYRVDIGFSTAIKHWGHGYTAEAVKKVVDYGFMSLNIIRFQAEIIPENVGSIKVCEKSGFQNEGVLHSYAMYDNNGECFKDIVMMALINYR